MLRLPSEDQVVTFNVGTGHTVKRKLAGLMVDPRLISIAEETDATVQEFFWEFVQIAQIKDYTTWPLFYLSQDGAAREWNDLETKLDDFIHEKLAFGLYGRAQDGSFCVRAADGTWRTLQSAYRLVKLTLLYPW